MVANAMVSVIDRAEIKKHHKDKWGNLHVTATVVKPGVYSYRQLDGSIRRELKHPDEIFAPAHMASVQASVVTDEHLPGGAAVVPENNSQHNAGNVTSKVVREDDELMADLIIRDAALIAAIEAREKTEVSLGLDCWYDKTPGVWFGEPYDVIQRGMVSNQVTVTRQARVHGSALHLDSVVMVPDADSKGQTMATMQLPIGGATVEVETGAGSVINAHLATLDSQLQIGTTALTEMTAARDTLQAKFDTATDELEKQKKLVTDSVVDIPKMVNARNKLMTDAAVLLDKEALLKVQDSTDAEVRAAACEAHKVNLKDDKGQPQSEIYLLARFDGLVETNRDKTAQNNAVTVLGVVGTDPKQTTPGQEGEKTPQQRIAAALTRTDSLFKSNAGGLRHGGGAQ